MVRVRWSVLCSGPCGDWLLAGSRAVKSHRALWCPDCFRWHRETCTVCQALTAAPVPSQRAPEDSPQLVLF